MNLRHIDEIKEIVISELTAILKNFTSCRIALIHDLYGKFKLVIWPEKEQENILIDAIKDKLSEFSPLVETDLIWISNKLSKFDNKIYDSVWEEGEPHIDEPRLRISERYRTHGGWIEPLLEPPWKKPMCPNSEEPPVLIFYSFKGGVGRTTALAAFAVLRARAGERVAVIDADLDAPGIGTILAADEEGTTSRWGVVDYILEKELQEIDFKDYYHACRRENITGTGEILIIPAGRIDKDYPWKLARLDMEPYADKTRKHIFYRLLEDVKKHLKPNWILIDVRAGLAVPAGILVGGFAHLNVIFGTSSEQSWLGLRLIIERLGARRLLSNQSQDDLILVHAMVPRDIELQKKIKEEFTERAKDEFTDLYYSASPDDRNWALEDIEGSEAPHNPIAVNYDDRLSTFRKIDQIIDLITQSNDYENLTKRILKYFGEE